MSKRYVPIAALLAALAGCESDAPKDAANRTAAQPAEVRPGDRPAKLAAGWDTWDVFSAVQRLDDEVAGVSAAVRLVRLAELESIAAPEPLLAGAYARLALQKLGPDLWVLGLRDRAKNLRAPLLIDAAGDVRLAVDGPDEELAVFCAADEEYSFPHLVLTPTRVILVEEPLREAIVLNQVSGLRFQVEREDGAPVLVLAPTAEPVGGERPLARYTWDAFESTFMGPATTTFPDGRYFSVDLSASRGLIPVGGQIKAAVPVESPVVEMPRAADVGPY